MISAKQYRKLLWIDMLNGTKAKDFGKRKELYQYLQSENLIRSSEVRGFKGYIVTEKGRAAMYTFRVEHFRFWFPSVVALIALIVSILSLATANPQFWQNVQEWVQAL